MTNYDDEYDFGFLDLPPAPNFDDFENEAIVDGVNLPMPERESDMDVGATFNSFSQRAYAARSGGIGDFPDLLTSVRRNNSSAIQNNATTNHLGSAPDMTRNNIGLPSFSRGGPINPNGPYEADHIPPSIGLVDPHGTRWSTSLSAPRNMLHQNDPFLFDGDNMGSDPMQRISAQEIRGWMATTNTHMADMSTQMAGMNAQMAKVNTKMANMHNEVAGMHTEMGAMHTQVAEMRTRIDDLEGGKVTAESSNDATRPMLDAQDNINTAMSTANAGPKKAAKDNGRNGSVTVKVYRLIVEGPTAGWEWQQKLKQEIPLPLRRRSPTVASVVEGAVKTRQFSKNAVSLKIKYKAESLTEDGQFHLISADELLNWLHQVRPDCDWTVTAWVYEEADESYAADDLLP